ncbi:ABA4-like family protein [Coraliomargarita akajimensis]|uniref:CdsA n=1 Tax=Coraliomargarita akajimensis (strain DSM 45221 / IAM 15411 / JCM 23193 / KCTC 12865 / 04OKA010-24) TaxID=583355 RepID=D5EIA1_CORAD|nr:ABA4-like family protein [Coraliomargarita akajimensis]ADE54167.1 CdsA [Coraliomargarita akajimensis DSM 45221]
MPIWIIESFGNEVLQQAFLVIALMTAPVWLGMIFFPRSKIVQHLANPWVLPPVYCTALVLLVWTALDASLLPQVVDEFSYNEAKSFSRHPMAFLLLFCNWQIINLAVGTAMYQRASRGRFSAPVELTLCWLFGAWALLPFACRLLFRKEFRR